MSERRGHCQAGEREAMQQLYERCEEPVYRLMVHIVDRQDAGTDLTRQVFLQIFLKIDRFAGQARFETWLYRVAMNEALQYLRKNRQQRTHQDRG